MIMLFGNPPCLTLFSGIHNSLMDVTANRDYFCLFFKSLCAIYFYYVSRYFEVTEFGFLLFITFIFVGNILLL